MPQLFDRAVQPWLDLPPVTTTVLAVSPGNGRIIQGQPLTIAVRAWRIGDDPPVIAISEDRRNWQRLGMTIGGGDQFFYNFPSVDHDFQYFVQGGGWAVRVLPCTSCARRSSANSAFTTTIPNTPACGPATW